MIGIIGGTGLYQMEELTIVEKRSVQTPFGDPSAPIVLGRMESREVAFLPRHGVAHDFLPSEINYRANIWALKAVGVRRIVGVSATGSLVQEIAPGDLALPAQYLDWTRGKRAGSFFGDGIAAHISTANPACSTLSQAIEKTARGLGHHIHSGKTYACVEGPRLGTRAESFFLKGAGCHLVGMTNVPEAFLAREAQLCYCTIAIATDYDCWQDDPTQHVSLEKVFEQYAKSLNRVKQTIRALVREETSLDISACDCRTALAGAVLTSEQTLSSEKRGILAFLRE